MARSRTPQSVRREAQLLAIGLQRAREQGRRRGARGLLRPCHEAARNPPPPHPELHGAGGRRRRPGPARWSLPLRERAETTSHCERCPSLVTLEPARVSCELPPVDGRHVDAAELAAALRGRGDASRRGRGDRRRGPRHRQPAPRRRRRRLRGGRRRQARGVGAHLQDRRAPRERAERGDAGQAAPRELGRGFHVADVGRAPRVT